MNNLFRLVLIALVILLVGGIGYVAFADVDAPSQEVEKKLSNDQFFAQ